MTQRRTIASLQCKGTPHFEKPPFWDSGYERNERSQSRTRRERPERLRVCFQQSVPCEQRIARSAVARPVIGLCLSFNDGHSDHPDDTPDDAR